MWIVFLMAKVTTKERNFVQLMLRDFARFERMGIIAAQKLNFRIQARVLRDFRVGKDPKLSINEQFDRAIPIVRDSMVASFLAGVNRARKIRNSQSRLPIRFQTNIFKNTILTLKKQLELTPEQFIKIEATYTASAVTIITSLKLRVQRIVQRAMIDITQRGLHIIKGVAVLREAFAKVGIVPKNNFALESIFRTQTQLGYSAGRWQADQDPSIQEILWGYKYVTVGDNRVRPNHTLLDGITLPKDDSRWNTLWTPNGWSCRCQIIPIFEPRKIVEPKSKIIDGRLIEAIPDKGFAFNAGKVFV